MRLKRCQTFFTKEVIMRDRIDDYNNEYDELGVGEDDEAQISEYLDMALLELTDNLGNFTSMLIDAIDFIWPRIGAIDSCLVVPVNDIDDLSDALIDSAENIRRKWNETPVSTDDDSDDPWVQIARHLEFIVRDEVHELAEQLWLSNKLK